MLYSCTHTATVGIKGLKMILQRKNTGTCVITVYSISRTYEYNDWCFCLSTMLRDVSKELCDPDIVRVDRGRVNGGLRSLLLSRLLVI